MCLKDTTFLLGEIRICRLNTFYRIDINKENESTKMLLQLCRIVTVSVRSSAVK